MAVFRSSRHIYVQLIDDDDGKTLCVASTMSKELGDSVKGQKKSLQAEAVGKKIAEIAKAQGIGAVVFDRKGWPFHGRIAALAKGAREGGLAF